MLSTELKLLDYLTKWEIEFGILDAEGQQQVQVNILNTDDTVTTTKMKVRDVMYFTEYGTITIPGKFILEKSLLYIDRLINESLNNTIDDIFNKVASYNSIERDFNNLCLKIQNYIRNSMIIYITKTNQLGQIFNEGKDENKYLFDLFKLKDYIRCVAIFKN